MTATMAACCTSLASHEAALPCYRRGMIGRYVQLVNECVVEPACVSRVLSACDGEVALRYASHSRGSVYQVPAACSAALSPAGSCEGCSIDPIQQSSPSRVSQRG